MPHLRRDRAHRCHICAGTGLTAATSAPGPGSPLPHLRRDWAHPCHICAGTWLALLHEDRLRWGQARIRAPHCSAARTNIRIESDFGKSRGLRRRMVAWPRCTVARCISCVVRCCRLYAATCILVRRRMLCCVGGLPCSSTSLARTRRIRKARPRPISLPSICSAHSSTCGSCM